MSYKKIVAGVATFAIAAAMVVPSAFAITSADAIAFYNKESKRPVPAAQKTEAKEVLAKAEAVKGIADKLEAEKGKLAKLEAELESAATDAKKKEITDKMDTVSGSIEQYTTDLGNAQKALDSLDGYYKKKYIKDGGNNSEDKDKPADQNKDENKDNTAKPEGTVVNGEGIWVNLGEGLKFYTLENLKDLQLDLNYVQDWTKEKKDAIASAEETLKCLERFEKRTTEIKYGDYVYTVDQLKGVLEGKLAELKNAKIKDMPLNKLQQLTRFIKATENAVKAQMKADPAALKKACEGEGCSDKKAAGKAAASSAAKGGKHLPKTADAAPVAPIAAVAGSAALIAAGLVASRKVNA